MMDMIQANGLAFTAALVAVLLIGWWLLRLATTTPRERHRSPDALDEGAAPAQRNRRQHRAHCRVRRDRLARQAAYWACLSGAA